MKKETNNVDIEEKVKIKKNKKKKSKLKIIGVVGLLYATLAIGFIDLKTKELEKSINETTLINYKKLENITEDQSSYTKYYNNYNYNEEMFQKDLDRYKNYENFLYEKYKDFSKANGAKRIIPKEEFIIMTNQLDYVKAKWSYFKNAYSDFPQYSGSYYSSMILPIFLEINDPNYNKIKSDVISKLTYRDNYETENNITWGDGQKSQIYYHPKTITIMVPFSLLSKEKYVAYNEDGVYRTQMLNRDVYNQEKGTLLNYNDLSDNFKELNGIRSKYNFKNKNEVKEFDEKVNKIIEKEYNRLSYDREYQYNTFKFLNANKALKESIDELTSSDGEKNLKLLDSEILYPASLVYSFYQDLAKTEVNKSYSNNYEDGELIYKILGIEDMLLKEEMIKNEKNFVGERSDLYPFLK